MRALIKSAASITFFAVLLVPGIAGAQHSHGGGGSRGGRMGGGHMGARSMTPRPQVVIKFHRVSVPKPNRITRPEHFVRDNRQINFPNRDERGSRISQPASRIPPQHHADVMRNHALVRNIAQRERLETVRNHYYWHADGGSRYCHYYDNFGVHWYGFYHGPAFYWTRLWGNRWWWYDPHYLRWVYWGNGYWWWPSPDGTPYVYTNDNYYPYESGGVTVTSPEVQTPPAATPEPKEGHVSASADMSRMVQIDKQGGAYLYDYSTGHQVYMKFLGQNVQKVKLSGGTDGKPVRILLEFKDGSFALYDAEGNAMEAPSVSSGDMPGAPPESTPAAPPTPAPGAPASQ